MAQQEQDVIAQLADGTQLHFPAGTSPEVVQKTVKAQIAKTAKTPAQAHQERAARSREGKTGMPTAQEIKEQQPGVAKNLAIGAGKSAAQGIQTVVGLVGAKVGENVDLEPRGAAQRIGAAGETVAEYATIDAALKGLTAAIKIRNVPLIQTIIRAQPRLAQIGEAAVRAFTIGTTQAALHGEANPVKQGLTTGMMGVAGETTSILASDVAKKALPKVASAVNKYIGLSRTDLPQWERMSVKGAEEVGQTVLDEVGVKNSLAEQREAIETVRHGYETRIGTMLQNSQARTVPLHATLNAAEFDLGDRIIKSGMDIGDVKTNALKANVQEFKNISNPQISVAEAGELRQRIGRRINWKVNDPTDVQQSFLRRLYFDLNDGIKAALPPDEAAQFTKWNRIQNRLIIARDAAGEKELSQSLKKGPGPVSRAATLAKRAAVGAAVGGGVGALIEGRRGAEVGAVGGAVLGAAGHHGRHLVGDSDLPGADVKASIMKPKVYKALSEAAKRSPMAQRALEALSGASGGGSGSIAQQ